ncbi:MAG: hypothetical protein CMB34_05045 [Euryarchaeota archaeon]|nr:hypothetical protein [Euryarchaeota archaeon]
MESPKPKKVVTNLSVRPSIESDCEYLAHNLRRADHNEVKAAMGVVSPEALLFSMRNTQEPLTIVDDDTPAGIFGVAPIEPHVGAIWLLGTDALVHGKWRFLRQSKKWLAHVGQDYELLFNYVDERNYLHIRWIAWLGFSFIFRHEKYGVEQRPFLEFVRIV